ncbi:hypothetical protein MMC25_005825 [Agyrium rufum]|nr:hypothetical protein [Agyrium rufum]
MASIILSWQAADWREWVFLLEGCDAVIQAMSPWSPSSRFQEFVDEVNQNFPTSPSPIDSPTPGIYQLLIEASRISKSLDIARLLLSGREEQLHLLRQLSIFLQNLMIAPPGPTRSEQLRTLYPLRSWMAWFPKSLVHLTKGDPAVLIALAQLNLVIMASEPLFPSVSKVYFTRMRAEKTFSIYAQLLLGGVRESGRGDETFLNSDYVEKVMREPIAVATIVQNQCNGDIDGFHR